jgi:hypothetical protein
MASVPATPAAETTEQSVVRLLATWREQTAHLSSSTQLTGHPAYQELIALGPAALPFLFRDLERSGDGHLSKVLTTLAGAHPVPAEDRGKIRKVADAWLRWARENGFQQ